MKDDNLHSKNLIMQGKGLAEARHALIMVHGRGGNARDILSLASYLHLADFALIAPQANGNAWYPYSFIAPVAENEPWLTSAVTLLNETQGGLMNSGIAAENIYFLGFSQGACLVLEYVARNARQFGGVVAFTGGLIGDQIHMDNYRGNFNSTPVFIGSSDPDPHVPVERVRETTGILRSMGADVTEKIYPGMGHTISEDEIRLANELIFNKKS